MNRPSVSIHSHRNIHRRTRTKKLKCKIKTLIDNKKQYKNFPSRWTVKNHKTIVYTYSLHHFTRIRDKRTTLRGYDIRHRCCAHLEASLQINVLHWLPAAIKRATDGEPSLMDMTMHSRIYAGITMKNFSHEKRASAESWKCNEGRSFSRVGGFIDHHRNRGRLERRSRASIGYWLCTGMITRSSKRTG